MPPTIVFGLSGPSCSGKTTVALNLLKLFPQTIIIHQDDFYKLDSQIPVHESLGIQDWDRPASFDMKEIFERIQKFRQYLQHTYTANDVADAREIQSHFASQWANPPEDIDKIVDTNVLESLKQTILQSLKIDSIENVPFSVVIVDGILLFHDNDDNDDNNDLSASHPRSAIDAGVFIYAKYETLKQRREARAGYATKEGIWTDPPGYFDSIVWPNFIKYHRQFIHAHPQILGQVANEGSTGIDSHVAVCSSETPVAEILQTSVQVLLGSWREQHS